MTSTLWINISTIWVSTLLYGIYLVLFARCMYIFVRGTPQMRQPPLLVSAVLMFLLSTVNVLVYLLEGAATYGSLGDSVAVEKLQVANVVVYVTNNVLADAVLIYRCYTIWRSFWIIIPPAILLVATMLLGYLVQLRLFFILSMTNNLFIPTLIAARLWWIIRRIRPRTAAAAATRRKGTNAMAIILESGLIYSIVVSIHMAYFHFQNPVDGIVYAALTQIVGMVPTLIIVRVGLGVSENGPSSQSTASPSPTSPSPKTPRPWMRFPSSRSNDPVETVSEPPMYMTYADPEADAEDVRTIVGSTAMTSSSGDEKSMSWEGDSAV